MPPGGSPERRVFLRVAAIVAVALVTFGIAVGSQSGIQPTPSGPADGEGKMAFARGGDIYVMRADGTGLTRLTHDPAAGNGQPEWSPDGSWIAFARTEEDPGIYVIRADGTGLRRLTAAPDGGPTWSPDGTRIAFTHWTFIGTDIYVVDVDGSGLARLTEAPGAEVGAAWSPGGTRIALEHIGEFEDDIYVMNADGTGLTRLTDNPAPELGPSWSPDGTRIAFSRVGDILVMAADGTGIRPVPVDVRGSEPDWSPDGTRLAFSSGAEGPDDIFVVGVDGTGLRNLTRSPEFEQDVDWQPPPGRALPVPAPSRPRESTERVDALELEFGPGPLHMVALEEFFGPVCTASRVHGDLDGDGSVDAAYVYGREPADGCASVELHLDHRLTVLLADGTQFDRRLRECRVAYFCDVHSTIDLDRDGRSELQVGVDGGLTWTLVRFYRLTSDGLEPAPLAPPGDPPYLTPGIAEFSFSSAISYFSTLRCDFDREGRPIVVLISGQERLRREGWDIHEVTLTFEDRVFRVASIGDYRLDDREAWALRLRPSGCEAPV